MVEYCLCYSGMLAVAMDNFNLHVIDIETRKQVRVFRGHSNRITSMVSDTVMYRCV